MKIPIILFPPNNGQVILVNNSKYIYYRIEPKFDRKESYEHIHQIELCGDTYQAAPARSSMSEHWKDIEWEPIDE